MEIEPSNAEPPKRQRRWFQFSLRTLLIFMLVCAVGCALVARRISQKKRDREAVEAIVKAGGAARYDYEIAKSDPAGPAWLRSILGDNFFAEVVAVDLSDTTFYDDELGCLDSFPALARLDLSGTEVTDDGLASLAKLPRLEALNISSTRITDAGLHHLSLLPNLKSLTMHNQQTTFAGHHPDVAHGEFYYSSLQIPPGSFVIVSQKGRPIAGGRPRRVVSGWEDHQPRITAAGFAQLARLSSLEFLDLEGTDVTSHDAKELGHLCRLRYLNVRGTNVSDVAIADLKGALPQLKTDRYFPPTCSTGGNRSNISTSVPDALIDLSR